MLLRNGGITIDVPKREAGAYLAAGYVPVEKEPEESPATDPVESPPEQVVVAPEKESKKKAGKHGL